MMSSTLPTVTLTTMTVAKILSFPMFAQNVNVETKKALDMLSLKDMCRSALMMKTSKTMGFVMMRATFLNAHMILENVVEQ